MSILTNDKIIGAQQQGIISLNTVSDILHGETITLAANSKYNAFPGLCRTANGNLLACWREATTHQLDKGIIVGRASTDNGKTWGAKYTLLSHATLDLRDPNLVKLSNGQLMLSYFTFDYGAQAAGHAFVAISNDDGLTFGTPVQIDGYTTWGAITAPILELDNGDLLAATYGLTLITKCLCYKSTDLGATWTELSTMNTPAGEEPYIIKLQNGNLLASIRNAAATKVTQFKISSDAGQTWSASISSFAADSRAPLIQLENGNIVTGYRNVNKYISFRYSIDNAVSWFSEISETISNPEWTVYCAFSLINDDLIGMVYCNDTLTNNVANCYFRYLDQEFLVKRPTINTKGIVNEGIIRSKGTVYQEGLILLTDAAATSQILMESTETGTGKIRIQAGYGSSNRGGSLSLYGNAHATMPGHVAIGLSANAAAKFRINTNGNDTGTDLFTVTETGKVGINQSTPNASAILDIASTTLGVALPRMSTTQRDAIATPAEGLEIYNLTLHKKQFYNGSAWETVTSAV